ncbi:GntR family transcriptional regulator [Pseudonocardia sichuanensis]
MSGPPTEMFTGLLSEQVHRLLTAQILRRDLLPGTRIVESELARQLSVSQSPVRDALRRLAHEGLVIQLPRRGTFVAEISDEDARAGYQVRAALEAIAAEQLAATLSERTAADLQAEVDAMVAAADADDLSGLIEHDVAFHRLVWERCGNPLLPRIWTMVEPSLRNYTRVSNRVYFDRLTEVADSHRPLVAALRTGDDVGGTFRRHVLEAWQRRARGAGETAGTEGA